MQPMVVNLEKIHYLKVRNKNNHRVNHKDSLRVKHKAKNKNCQNPKVKNRNSPKFNERISHRVKQTKNHIIQNQPHLFELKINNVRRSLLITITPFFLFFIICDDKYSSFILYWYECIWQRCNDVERWCNPCY